MNIHIGDPCVLTFMPFIIMGRMKQHLMFIYTPFIDLVDIYRRIVLKGINHSE